MEQADLRSWERQCTQEDMPKCRAACPLHMDVRPFLEHMAHGDVAGARKVMERYLPLPGVLGRICEHPCEGDCLRRELGGSIAVGALERACVSLSSPQTRLLPRPPKNKRVVVIGDGMAGLVAAWDLSRKGYPVELFYEGEKPGSGLLDAFKTLSLEVLEAELEVLRRGGVTLTRRRLEASLLEEAADARFVDVSCAPALAPARELIDPVTLLEAGTSPSVCFGGWPAPDGGKTPVAWAAEGRRAAMTMERQMTGVSLTASRENEGATATRLHTPLDGVAPWGRVEPLDEAGGYSSEEARTEAGRCLQCECLICVRECLYMQKYKAYPRVYARQMYNNAAIVKGHHQANTLINSCALCGQCEVLCPEGFSMADLCLSFRQDMVRRGMMPPSAHEFALEDMAVSNGPDCALTYAGSEAGRCEHVFFPGCQLAGGRGAQVLSVYEHLRGSLSGGVGLMLRCCGVPARWAGEEGLFAESLAALRREWESLGKPRVIAACASCCKTLREAAPDMVVVSLWEVLDAECPFETPALTCCDEAPVLSVHDPCSARHDEKWRGAVRSLLAKRGVRIEEPRLTGETTPCCGYGGLLWNVDPGLAASFAADRAAQLEHDAVASCIMCRDRLAAGGKPSLHMLDVLLPTEAPLSETARAKGPGLSARRAGRAALRSRVLERYCGQEAATPGDDGLVVRIALDVLERMEERHILREDAVRVVRHAEVTGDKFLNRDNGHFLASLRPVRVTFWVEYAVEEGVYIVHDAYCHRMEVPGTSTPEGRYEASRNPFHL
ncbi:pyridine nucleotide-disulfide oxidoreductase/dicluster-binding protein [uncultured Bilophila sp.]|uniref:pyridine nucleotide-disulfide oxidoreductase/dicluster-binding protein n=1 Tax=uncultured Bilophila sp. TaxID=529385 RepID=UPI0026332848|nr:pyridine nucleotide-disulfide oxidoreductase/dicluster-binding protein [uncultured Bilophila sp.]